MVMVKLYTVWKFFLQNRIALYNQKYDFLNMEFDLTAAIRNYVVQNFNNMIRVDVWRPYNLSNEGDFEHPLKILPDLLC